MVLGVLFCRTSAVARERRRASAIALAGLSSVLAICAFAADAIPYLLLHNGLLLIPFSALIFGLAHSESVFAKMLSGKWLDTLGRASYALYITHVPMIHYVQALQRRLPLTAVYSGYELLPLLLLLIVLSVVLLHYFEEPARQWIMRGWKARMVSRNQAA
jgi:peptidoglycan/LPS O-acetylase OafA/YrhL